MSELNNKSLKIGVIGHLVKDEITTLSGIKTVALGGITYNLAVLNSVVDRGVIYPFCRIGNDINELVTEFFGQFPKINPRYISHSKRPNRVHKLRYMEDGSRAEWNSVFSTPLSMDYIPDNLDALLINFISGNDVRLKDLSRFRKRFRNIIYCDFHSLSLGINKDGTRYLRKHRFWKEYLMYAEIVQMNFYELTTIFSINSKPKIKDILECCRELHKQGPKIVIITLADLGVIISAPAEGIRHHVRAVKPAKPIDPTGCGDTLAGSFLSAYLRSNDILSSIESANSLAAAKVTFSGIKRFSEIIKIVNSLDDRSVAMPI